jgi:hypothetical protein
VGGSAYCGLITARAIDQAASNPTDRRNANASKVVNFSIGQIFLEILNDLPAVNQRLELCRGAKIFKKTTYFLGISHCGECPDEGRFGTFLLTVCFVSIRLHVCTNVIVC